MSPSVYEMSYLDVGYYWMDYLLHFPHTHTFVWGSSISVPFIHSEKLEHLPSAALWVSLHIETHRLF